MTDTASALNPAATDHLPWFVSALGQTDVLLNVAAATLLFTIFAIGTLYLRLHALPDQIAHKANNNQLHIVGALTLIALFTHNNAFWILALLVAMIELPDFVTPLGSMARSLRRMARPEPPDLAPEPLRALPEPPAAPALPDLPETRV